MQIFASTCIQGYACVNSMSDQLRLCPILFTFRACYFVTATFAFFLTQVFIYFCFVLFSLLQFSNFGSVVRSTHRIRKLTLFVHSYILHLGRIWACLDVTVGILTQHAISHSKLGLSAIIVISNQVDTEIQTSLIPAQYCCHCNHGTLHRVHCLRLPCEPTSSDPLVILKFCHPHRFTSG